MHTADVVFYVCAKCSYWLAVRLHFDTLCFVHGQGQRTEEMENKS